VRGEASTLIAMIGGMVAAIPPGRPFSELEQAMIQPPLEATLYKYGTNLDPAVQLCLALGTVAFLRWQEYRQAKAAGDGGFAPPKPPAPAEAH
jgi:hypothetical protein